MSFRINSANRQKHAVQQIYGLNGLVRYDHPDQSAIVRNNPRGGNWHLELPTAAGKLEHFFGIDYFYTVISVSVSPGLRQSYAAMQTRNQFGSRLSFPMAPRPKTTKRIDWDVAISATSNLDDVEWIKLDCEQITATQLELLARCRRINRLTLRNCTLDNSHAPALRTMTALRFIEAPNCFTAEGIDALAGHPNIEQLYLSYRSAISDDSATALASMPNLAVLDVSGSSISDKGVKELSKLNVRWLDLSFSNVTDKSIDEFAKMKSLRDLRLHGTKITPAGIIELRNKMAGVDIVYSSADK